MPGIAAVDALKVPRSRWDFQVRFPCAWPRLQQKEGLHIDLAAAENLLQRGMKIAAAIELSEKESAMLVALSRGKKVSVRLAERSEIILLASQGGAKHYHCSPVGDHPAKGGPVA
ncbi:MAG: hypothetical protein SGI71_10615 [Verrucomicrobiota bacterium]|nr:hypothetical protein [Verrucomicrobiota bacterium]